MKITSRKLIVLIVSIVFFSANQVFAFFDENTAQMIAVSVVGWLVSQGIADAGSQGAVIAARRAVKEGGEAGRVVIDYLREEEGDGGKKEQQ